MKRDIRSSVAFSTVARDRADNPSQLILGKMCLTVANVIIRSHK